MGWIHLGPYRYYRRSERRGKAIRTVHLGNGELARLAADLDELGRLERQDRARAWRGELARREAAEALLDGLERVAGLLVEATLTRAGYHRHDRGKWRRRMNPGVLETMTGPLTLEDARGVLEAASRGDRSVLPALRGLLDAHPQVWSRLGDLAAHAERAWVDLAAGPDLALGESISRKLAGLKAELAGPTPSPLERLLVDRVAATWVQLTHADAVAAWARGRDLSPAQLDHLARRQARAGRGHVEAIKALAMVRKLLPAAPRPKVAADRECRVEAMRREARGARPGKPPGPVEKATRAATRTKAEGRREETTVVGIEDPQESAIPATFIDRMRGLVESVDRGGR